MCMFKQTDIHTNKHTQTDTYTHDHTHAHTLVIIFTVSCVETVKVLRQN